MTPISASDFRLLTESERYGLYAEAVRAIPSPEYVPRDPSTKEECRKRIDELHKEIERVAWIAEGSPRISRERLTDRRTIMCPVDGTCDNDEQQERCRAAGKCEKRRDDIPRSTT